MTTDNHDQTSQNSPKPGFDLADDLLVVLAPRPSQIENEPNWAGRRINHLVSEGMAPDAACRLVIDELQVSHPDENEGDCTYAFLEWVFGDNPPEMKRWCRLAHVSDHYEPMPYEKVDWLNEGF